MSGLLYGKEHERIDIYRYQINSHGPQGIVETGQVTITFQNGKFHSAVVPFTGTWSRNAWSILSAINDEIIGIEASI